MAKMPNSFSQKPVLRPPFRSERYSTTISTESPFLRGFVEVAWATGATRSVREARSSWLWGLPLPTMTLLISRVSPAKSPAIRVRPALGIKKPYSAMSNFLLRFLFLAAWSA